MFLKPSDHFLQNLISICQKTIYAMYCPRCTPWDALTTLLVVTFGTSTWVSLGGLWVELPLLTNLGVPEGYSIGSYFIIVTQAAAIGPLLFVACQYLAPKNYHLEIPAIYVTLAVGATASFLLIFFWDSYSFWFGREEHSTAFLSLAFFMALVDSTSNLTFLPFISSLKSKYLNWYFIGEGLSSVIPSFVVLIQGSGGDDECVANYTFINTTQDTVNNITLFENCTVWEVKQNGRDALFTPQVYYSFIFALFTLSTTSYCLLRFLPTLRDQYDDGENHVQSNELGDDHGREPGCCLRCCTRRRHSLDDDERTPLLGKSKDNETRSGQQITSLPNNDDNSSTESCMGTGEQQRDFSRHGSCTGDSTSHIGTKEDDVTVHPGPSQRCFSAKQYAFLFTTLTVVSALTYGVLPSIQSYSAGGYGSQIYLLATAFAEISVPIGFFLVMIRPTTSYIVVLLTSLGGIAASVYCTVSASLSPTPPLQEHAFGHTLIVLAWILQGLFFSYCRATIGCILRSDTRSRLSMMCFGGCTTIGTMLGGVIMFPLVSVLDLFKSFDPSQACAHQVTCILVEYQITDPL